MEENLPENQIELPNSLPNVIHHKMNAQTKQEASPHLAESPSLNPVNPSLAPLKESSKECNMHLLANAVDHVMYHPPISTTDANLANMPAAPVQQQHEIISTPIGSGSSSPFHPPAIMATCKENSLATTTTTTTTTSHTMNIGVGLVPVQNYSSQVQISNSSTPSSNYLPSESSHTVLPSVSSMQDGVGSKYMTPSSMSLPNHIVHSASSFYVSDSITESPSSSQYVVGTTRSSVFSPAAGTIHRPSNSMQDSSSTTTTLQPSSSELTKSSSSLAQKDPPVMPSGSNVLPAETTAPAVTNNIPLPASDPLYIPMSSLQSNVMMSSSSPQFQIPSSSVICEHKSSTSSPSVDAMLGVSSSFENQATMIGPASPSSASVSTSKKANLYSSDSSSLNVTAVPQHLNTGENGPTSSVSTHNSLHSTTGSQDCSKPSIFSQPSSTMLSQGDAASSCSSSMSESVQLSSTENNYPLSHSDSPSGPSSSELSSVQVPSSSFSTLDNKLNSELLNNDKSAFSNSDETADNRNMVSGSTDSHVQLDSDSLLGSSKDASTDAVSLNSHITQDQLDKTKISASSSDVSNTNLQKVTSGSGDKVTSASGDKVISGFESNVINETKADSDKGISTSGLSGENNSLPVNVSLEVEQVTSGCGNVSTGTCVTSVANDLISQNNTPAHQTALSIPGPVTSSPEWNENNVNSGGKELSVSGSTDSDHVTSGTNISFEQVCLSSEANNCSAVLESTNIMSGTNNVSSDYELSSNDNDSCNSNSANSSKETKSSADCSNSVLESDSQITNSDRSNVSSSLIKNDQDFLSSSLSGMDANYANNVENSLHRKELLKEKMNFGDDANSPMKADSSSSSLKMKPLVQNSVSKDDNSCTSTITDLDTNCPKSEPKNETEGIKSDMNILDSKANSTIGDSALSEIQKNEDDAGPALKKAKIAEIPKSKDNLIEMESSEIKVEMSKMEPASTGSPLSGNATEQGKKEVDEKSSPPKKAVKCADTSTDLGANEVSPGKCQKRKRSQSPVSSSLGEPRRSSRQPKSKFNVVEVLGIGVSVDHNLEDERVPIKQVARSSAVVADSSFSGNIKEEVLNVTDKQIEDMFNNSFDSNSKFKEKLDLEKMLVPFEQGWRREVVIRGVYEEFTKSGKPKRVPADVYYYAPDRRKLRSKVQIATYLTEHKSNLTVDNFNFMRKPIYKEPFESVRNASRRSLPKPKNSKSSPKGLPKPEVVLDIAQPEDGCNTTEEEEDTRSIEPEFEMALAATALTVQQVVPSRWVSGPSGGCKELVIKSEPMEIENIKTENADEHVIALQTLGKHSLENSNSLGKKPKKTKSVARKSTSQLPKSISLADVMTNAEPFQPCSLNCPGLAGIPPTLHCDICMCLFHIDCVNLKDNEVPKVFTCKNCSKDERLLRNKITVKSTSNTTPTSSVMVTTTTMSSSSSTVIASKAIPASLISIASPNNSTSNTVNTITDSTTSESDKKGNKVASKPSVIQSSSPSSTKDITVVTQLPKKHVTITRRVVLNTPLSMLNGSPVSSPIQVVAEDHSRNVSTVQLTPDSSNYVTCSTQDLSDSVRTPIIPSRMKFTKTGLTYSLLSKKSPSSSTPSSSLPLLLPKVNTSVIAAASPSSSPSYSLKNNSVTTIMTTPSSPSPPPASSSSSTTTTITTTTSSPSSISIATSATTTTHTNNVTTSESIDCTKDLTIKNSLSLTPESPMIVSPSQLVAPPSQMSTSETTSSSSIKMETLSSSSPSSSSPSSSSSTSYAHSGSGVNSVVGLQVSNTLLGSESYPRSGQLLTLPSAVAKRLNPSLPLALRINNMQLLIPPSRCINTAEGLKVFLPPKTFSVPSGSTTTMNITFSSGSMSADNAKDLSLSMLSKDKSMSLDMCDQVVDLSKTAETSKQMLKITERRNKMKSYLCPFKTLYTGYNTMIQIFSYLSAGDLVRCSLVCRTWRRLTTQACLWNAIHLENTRISDWARATQFFSRYLVEELSLRGMQYEDDWNRVWHQLTPVLEQLTTLKRLYFDHVPALMLYTVCQKLPQLEDLGANMISDFTNEQQWTIPTKIDLAKFCSLKNLRKLQLRGTGGLASSFSSGISEMVTLKHLQHLSLTSMRSVGDHDLDYLGELKGLKVLEIGNCTNWTSETYFQLGKLVNLQKLRLEHGGEIPDVGLADALFNLKSLCQLELITFVIADTLHLTLSQLKNLRKFVVWPDTSQQAALVNSNTFVTVIKLPTLKQLEWGVTQNNNSSIILNEPCSVTTESNMESDKDSDSDKLAMIPFLSPDAQELINQTPNNNSEMMSASEKFTEYIGMRQLDEKLKCLLTNTQVTVFRTLDDTNCVSSW